jgi:hypothetical protein
MDNISSPAQPCATGIGFSTRAAIICALTLLILVLSGVGAVSSAPYPEDKLPPVLQPWCDWVLHQEKEYTCTPIWDQTQKRECVWPSELYVRATAGGAEFTLSGHLDKAAEIILPGSARYWPRQVTNKGKEVSVLRDNAHPVLELGGGAFKIEGAFTWEAIPDSIPITPGVGMVRLELDGTSIPDPVYAHGHLNLRQRHGRSSATHGGMAFQVYRQLEDSIPQILTTLVKVRISGSEREVLTAKVLPDDFTALDIQSDIPARLDEDGRLRLLAQPGEYEIIIKARNTAALKTTQLFTRPSSTGPWTDDEVWSIKRRGELRSLSISGAPVLDPAQTDLPAAWKHQPAYLMAEDTELKLTQEERGLQAPSTDRLRIKREMWLDFNAMGYSVRDSISGTMHTRTRLESTPELHLGRARLNGEEQFITRLEGNGADGIEVRQQNLNLQADSRIESQSITSIPALGWNFSPTELHTELNLPPGWRVLAGFGADSFSGTWVQQWSLLDLFVVLFLSIGFMRMWGWKYGLVALLGLVLTYQEPNAPRFIWLHLLGAAALLRVAPRGRLEQVVRLYLGGAALTMVAVLTLFSIQQIRSAVYPQLEARPASYASYSQRGVQNVHSDVLMERAQTYDQSAKMMSATAPAKMAGGPQERVNLPGYSTSLETQTGPGIPTWKWRSVAFTFNTAMTPDERVSFIFSTPWITRIALVAGILLTVYMFGRIGLALKPDRNDDKTDPSSAPPETLLKQGALIALPCIFGGAMLATLPSSVHARELSPNPPEAIHASIEGARGIPSAEMLEELRRRLTQAPDCAPNCAALQQIHVEISAHTLTIEQQIHSAIRSAVPLAFPLAQLTPARASTGSGTRPLLLRSPQGEEQEQLWGRVESGITSLTLSAPLPAEIAQVEIPLPLRAGDISIDSSGWDLLNKTDNPSNSAILSFKRTAANTETELESMDLPLYAELQRRLELEVEWSIDTTLRRVSSLGSSGSIPVPLLEGEQIVSNGIETREGEALVEIGPETRVVHWRSRLEQETPIELHSGDPQTYHQVWQLKLSPLWHVTSSGTPLIYAYQNGTWLAEWRPRAQESLSLHIKRPPGSPGEHITVEGCTLEHRRGVQRSESTLRLDMRSSVATRHAIELPSTDINVEQVRRNGREIRIEQNGAQLILPLNKGAQEMEITWSREHELKLLSATPEIDLNAPGVNLEINLRLPQTRWVLFTGGPLMGPAVLFWGTVVVIALAALLLGRYAPTPLRWWHWFILGAGLSQAPLAALLLVVFWLILLGIRKEHGSRIRHGLAFNTMQLGLAVFSVCALLALVAAVQQGLLGLPEMQVVGQNSSAWNLHWYQDRISSSLPTAWVITVPLLVYRVLMLIWALWLALALLHWLRWGWGCYSAGELWRSLPRRAIKPGRNITDSAEMGKHTRSGKDG